MSDPYAGLGTPVVADADPYAGLGTPETASVAPTQQNTPVHEGLINSLFDLDGAPDRATAEGKAAFAALASLTPNTKEIKAQAVNQAYVQAKSPNLSPDIIQHSWPAVRDAYAKSLGHTENTITETGLYDLTTKNEQKSLQSRWATVSPWERLKMMFGSHGYGHTDVEGAVPAIGSEAAGTKGGAFTIPKMEGDGTLVGLINAANKMTSGLMTPENAAIAVVTGGAGALAELATMTRAAVVSRATQAAALGTFAVVGAKDTVNATAEARVVMNDPKATNADKADAIATAVLSGVMTIAAAKGTYDFAGAAKGELSSMDATTARAEAVKRLREHATQPDVGTKTAETLNKVADEIESLPPIVEPKPIEATKAGEAQVEDMDGGGFAVVDKDGSRVYVQDRADADALAKELGAKAVVAKADQAQYEDLHNQMDEMGHDQAGTPEFDRVFNEASAIKDRNGGNAPETKAAEPAPAEVRATEAAKTPAELKTTVDAARQAVVSIKNASVDEALAKMGMEPATHGEKLTHEEARADAAAKMEADSLAGHNLVLKLEADPRPVTGRENAILLHELNRLTIKRAQAEQSLIEATNMGDVSEIADAKLRVQQVTEDYRRAAEVDAKVGTANAIGLAFRQMMMREDYSLAAVERRAIVANDSKPLSPEQKAEVVDLQKDIAAKAQAEVEGRERRSPQKQKGTVLKFINEQADAARARIAERLLKAGGKGFVEGENTGGLLSKENLTDLATVGADYIARGSVKLAAWSEQMVKEFGEAIKPHIKAIYDKAVGAVEDAKVETAFAQKKARLKATIAQLEEKVKEGDTSRDPVAANRPSSKEIEQLEQQRDSLRDELSTMRAKEDKISELEASIAEKTTKIEEGELSAKGQSVNRPAPKEIEELKQRRDELNRQLADARKEAAKPTEAERIQKQVEALQERIAEKKDAIKAGDVAPKETAVNRPAIQAIEEAKQELADLNRQISELRNPEKTPEQQRMSKLNADITRLEEQIAGGEIFPKGKKPSVSSPEIKAAEKRLAELTLERDSLRESIQPSPEPKTEVELESARLDKQIEELERQIRTEEVFSKGKGQPIEAPELKAQRDRVKELKKERQNIRDRIQPKEAKSSADRRLEAFKARREKATEELKRRIKEGDFEPKPKPEELHLDEEANRLQAEHDLAKLEFDRLLERYRYENSSAMSKAAQQGLGVYDAARLLMTTGEFSFILRQGKVGALSHPIMTAKALPDTFRAFMEDPVGAHAINLQVLNHPDTAAARTAKLHLMDEGASLHKTEEILVGKLLGEKIPVVGKLLARFNQAATVFLNRLRFDLWNDMRKVGMTAAEEKQLAMFVNEATGRGGLGSLEAAAVPLGRLMFSPRYFASRIQLATGHALWGGTWQTRRVIAGEYAKTLVGLGLYYSALSLYFQSLGNDDLKIGADPRSSDFGKVKIGKSRLDPLAGVAQVAVFAARSATGETVSTTGKEKAIRGPKVSFGGDKWSDVAARFARSKLHPVPGAIVNLFDGTDLGGNEATLLNQGVNLSGPVTYMDIYQALEEQDLPEGVSLGLLAMLGEGLQTFDPKRRPAKK